MYFRGPNNATIGLLGDNGVRVNVSGLTKGEYEFLLVVEDESKLTANSSVKITVIQSQFHFLPNLPKIYLRL